MVLYFDDCDVAINRSGIMATSATLTLSNSISPSYSVGYKGTVGINPEGPIRSVIQISYVPEINTEPNYWTVQTLKTLVNDTIYNGNRIEVGGIVQDHWFLTSYSLKIQPNGIPDVSVQYETYWPICSTDITKKEGRFNYATDASVPHAWQASVSLANSDGEIYDFTYNFKANWAAVYTIGSKYPSQVELLGGEENFEFSTNLFRNVLFSGENIINNFIEDGTNVMLRDLAFLCVTGMSGNCYSDNTLTFSTSGAKIQAVEPVFAIGDIVRTSILANKYF